jgi:(p)ppGpp synthase/HD superfamily hydrolase
LHLADDQVAQTHLQLLNQARRAGWGDADLARAAETCTLATQLFDGRYRRNGRPFVAHVVGTASILLHVGARPDVVLAGLLHAAYDDGDSARARVRAAVGAETEALVTAYAAVPWSAAWLRERLADERPIPSEERDVLLMRVANQLEDLVDDGARHGSPRRPRPLRNGAMLAERLGVPELARHLRDAADTVEAMGTGLAPSR